MSTEALRHWGVEELHYSCSLLTELLQRCNPETLWERRSWTVY